MNSINNAYRFFALTMALLIFITSVGFTMDMHYCKDELKSVNFFGKAKSCHEVSEGAVKKVCPHHQKMMEQSDNCSMDKKDCCENKTYHFQADDTQQVKTDNFVENLPLQRALIAQVFQLSKQQLIETDTPAFAHYQPPLIPRDIPVLIQSFLL
jgi:hypothetical protein